jgi:hypothetical protein
VAENSIYYQKAKFLDAMGRVMPICETVDASPVNRLVHQHLCRRSAATQTKRALAA